LFKECGGSLQATPEYQCQVANSESTVQERPQWDGEDKGTETSSHSVEVSRDSQLGSDNGFMLEKWSKK